jgi:hypothetical protein
MELPSRHSVVPSGHSLILFILSSSLTSVLPGLTNATPSTSKMRVAGTEVRGIIIFGIYAHIWNHCSSDAGARAERLHKYYPTSGVYARPPQK